MSQSFAVFVPEKCHLSKKKIPKNPRMTPEKYGMYEINFQLVEHWYTDSTFDLTRNERGLIGDRHLVNKRAAANRYGNVLAGALKICEVVLHNYRI